MILKSYGPTQNIDVKNVIRGGNLDNGSFSVVFFLKEAFMA